MAINLGDNELPKQWALAKLPDFTNVVMGQSPASETYNLNGDGLPFFQGKSEFGAIYPSVNKYCSIPNKIAEKGATLLSIRAPVGPTNIASTRCCIGRGLAAIHPMCGIDPKFIFLLFRSIELNLSGEGTGSTFNAITKGYIDELTFAVPPLNEQKRIVAKIEELFSELDNGIAALKTAREQLKVYRQAILKHAFEGKLTAKWREENPEKLELPEQLLARIQQERDTRYLQQLEKWKVAVNEWEVKGKEGKRPTKPKTIPKNEYPNEEELENLCILPPSWVWVKLGQLTWSVKDGPHYSPEYRDEGIPFITGGNVRPSGVDFDNVKFISKELHNELSERCKPEYGDILYTKGGTTGIARVNTYDFDFNVWVHVAVLKITDSLMPFYIQHVLNSPGCYAQSQKYTHGVGNQDLGLTRMVNIIVPICCFEEQNAIIAKIDLINSELDVIERSIEENLKRANILRQSILKKAFSGKLVPQDLNDEPASELLEQIKTNKDQKKKPAKKSAPKPSRRKVHMEA